MDQSSKGLVNDDRILSRRKVVKGGLATAAGAVATFMAVRTGNTAATPMDVNRRMSTSVPVKLSDK